MTRHRHPNKPSRDDIRAAVRLARQELNEKDVNVSLKPSARRRLNWLKENFFKCDSQSMAINLITMRLTGKLNPWEDGV